MKLIFIIFVTIFTISCGSNLTKTQSDGGVFLDEVHKGMDERLKPIVLRAAYYPKKSLNDKIEGYCMAKFNIEKKNRTYSTSNIIIYDCNPKGHFESTCKLALQDWIFVLKDKSQVPDKNEVFTAVCPMYL